MKPVPHSEAATNDIRFAARQEHSLLSTARQCPQLLVSVRSCEEARQAIWGGVEILDIKEPARGSLGMADIDDVIQIAGIDHFATGKTLLSVALGEVVDWAHSMTVPALPAAVSFAKLGLHQCATRADWRDAWRSVRTRFESCSESPLRWVAVAYADADNARSPSVSATVEEAIESDCAGLLIDTWNKSEGCLIDHVDTASLVAVANDCHAAGLFFAIAGKIGRGSLSALSGVAADVIGIRSAACVRSDRTSEIDGNLVAEFKQEVRRILAGY